MNLLNKIPFGLRRRLRSGINLTIYPTLRCNYSCGYCSQYTFNGSEPVSDTIDWDEWYLILSNFPLKIQQVHLTGGEPLLEKKLTVNLIEYLCYLDIYVVLYTNLSIYTKLPIDERFRMTASYHHGVNKERFLKNYDKYKNDGHNTIVEEIGSHSNLPEIKTRLKAYDTLENGTGGMTNRWLLSPDGMLFYNQLIMHRYLNKRYNPSGFLKSESYEERLKERKEK